MPASRIRALQRIGRRLVGWRLGLLALSASPLLGLLVWGTGDWALALLTTVAVLLPSVAVLFIQNVEGSRVTTTLSSVLGTTGRAPIDLTSIERKVDVLDAVVSSESRRPWEPTTRSLIHIATGESKPVLLLPGADYHLPEIAAIAEELDSRGVPSVMAVGVPHWERTGDGLIWYDRDIYEAPSPQQVPELFSAVVTMKDWAGYGPLIEAANDADIPTFAKVEGAQDFGDVDTKSPRHPYRTARHILCQGRNDYDALQEMRRTIVGSTRLERLWSAPSPEPQSQLAIINLNFTYGMLTDARTLWLRTAVEGCELAGIPYVVSVHPAEKARSPHPKTTAISASRLLRHATVLISRFSTLPYEAMARGVPFIYHNPHNERVPSFKESHGAFPTTIDSPGLSAALSVSPRPREEVREQVEVFFRFQVDINPDYPSHVRSADVILAGVTEGSADKT